MVAWSNTEDPVTQRQMKEFVEELTRNLGVRQAEITTRLEMADNVLTAADQQFRILEQTMGARVQSIEEALHKTMEEVVNHKEMIDNMRTTVMALENGMQEIHDAMVNVVTETATRTTATVRRADACEGEVMRINNVLGEADQCVKNLNSRLAAVETKAIDKVRGGLIDPKYIVVDKYDGKNTAAFGDWRDNVERLVNAIYPGLNKVMRKIRQDKTKITRMRIEQVKEEVEADGTNLRWDIGQANEELGVYIISKLSDKPKLTAESAKLAGGLEMYRLLHQRYDRISEDTEALLSAAITKLGANQASNLHDLRDKLTILEKTVEQYSEKMGHEPPESLLGSVLTTILDAQTRREFVNIGGIIGKYERMKEKIGELASDSHGPKAMDIGAVDPAEIPSIANPDMGCQPCQPCLGEVENARFRDMVCWHCNQKGHPSYLCPQKQGKDGGKQGKGGAQKGAGKGQWRSKGGASKGAGKGQWGQKGGGKGGKGAYGLEAADNEESWWDDQWFDQNSDRLPGLGSLETAVKPVEDDDVSMADSEDVPGHVDSDSEEETEPEWMKQRRAIPEPAPVTQQTTDVEESEDADLTGWNVKVSRKKRKAKKSAMKMERTAVPVKGKRQDPIKAEHTNQRDDGHRHQWSGEWLKSQWRIKEMKHVNILERTKKELNEMGKHMGGWRPLELTVDSGAADTVTPEDTLEGFDVDTSEATEDGFVVADGSKIPNLGKKKALLATRNWSTPRNISFQVAPVHKTLLSVSKLTENNHRVVFEPDGAYIEDLASGERTELIKKNGLYVLRAWVRQKGKQRDDEASRDKNVQPFHRQGR